MKVFVYGTLKQGYWNHRHLNTDGEARFIANGHIAGLSLYEDVIPFAVAGDGRLYGEIYDVSEETIARLDELEGVDQGWYERLEMSVDVQGEKPMMCFVYVYKGDTSLLTHIPSGKFGA